MNKAFSTDEEIIILREQSCLSLTGETWKPGFLCLTNKRLFFSQPSGTIVFEVYLENVIEVKPVIGKFILGLRRRLLNMLCRSRRRGRLFQAFFAVNKLEHWERATREAKAHRETEK